MTIGFWVGQTVADESQKLTQVFHPLQMICCPKAERSVFIPSPFILVDNTLPMKVRARDQCRPRRKSIHKRYSHKLSLDFISCGPFRSGQKLKSMIVQIIFERTKSLLRRLFGLLGPAPKVDGAPFSDRRFMFGTHQGIESNAS